MSCSEITLPLTLSLELIETLNGVDCKAKLMYPVNIKIASSYETVYLASALDKKMQGAWKIKRYFYLLSPSYYRSSRNFDE